MARKPLKREVTSAKPNEDSKVTDNRKPVSSGDTIMLDSDETVRDEPMHDEVYQIRTKSSSRAPVADALNEQITNGVNEGQHVEDGLQVLGRGVKKLVQVVQELRHLGVEDLNLPLPKIVVVGDQSTGKSSLIEGISEIKVPRSAGTCTRCPMEINIRESSSPWNCQVSLHKKYVYEGNATNSRGRPKAEGATRARPLGPWILQDVEDFHFTNVNNKDDVAQAIYLAQLATLNPGCNYQKYLPGTNEPREHQVKFSPNIVRLDISGPDLPNLSFYDLPGVINVSELSEEAYLVDLVKNLVKEYICAEDCINLLALPMTDDPANSSASRLVREVGAESRTLGCLTKPDRLQHGESLQQWADILGGQRFKLGLGYHVIMNNPAVDVNHSIAREQEHAFFSEQEPWCTTFSAYARRFGTLQLRMVLSQRLTVQIRKSLPRITEQVQEKAEDIQAKLSQLPEPLNRNLAISVMTELIKFQAQLEKNIDGGEKTNSFHKEWNLIVKKLCQDLSETRPVLVFPSIQRLHGQNVFSTPTSKAKGVAPIAVDSDESDVEDAVVHVGKKRPPPSSSKTSPPKLQRPSTESPSERNTVAISKRFTLHEVRNTLQDAYTGLSNLVDPRAIEEMILQSMAHWEKPMIGFLRSTRQLCENMVFEQVQSVYLKYSDTQYFEMIRQICESFFAKVFSEQAELLQRILSWEQSKPKTCDDAAIDHAYVKALTVLSTKRHEMRASAYLDEQEARSGKQSSGQARAEKLLRVSEEQLGPDQYKKEIEAISTVKAYYQCACFRFVDVVSASVHCELFAKCRNDIVKEMKKSLALTEPDVEERLRVLLAANPVQEQRRSQLRKEMDTIAKAQERLEDLSDDE
ncbi:hypothetical protein ACLMJK_007912 [Lecanora helva]